VTLAGIGVLIGIAFAIPEFRDAVGDALHGRTAQVRHDLRSLGAWGVVLVFGLALIHAVVWYLAEILDAAAGFVYGFGPALPLVLAGWIASAILSYYIGRHAARPLLYKLVGEERFLRAERLVDRGGVTFLLAARLVPIVPFSLTGYVAGAARVPFGRFVWTTAVGYVPITAYFVYVGSRLESFSAEDPIVLIGAGALLLAVIGARFLLTRSVRGEGKPAAEG
jgi:uncharacterized membrane protein YdjX (TVP38/TMEM64 family)